jgi:hypothetical protein
MEVDKSRHQNHGLVFFKKILDKRERTIILLTRKIYCAVVGAFWAVGLLKAKAGFFGDPG